MAYVKQTLGVRPGSSGVDAAASRAYAPVKVGSMS